MMMLSSWFRAIESREWNSDCTICIVVVTESHEMGGIYKTHQRKSKLWKRISCQATAMYNIRISDPHLSTRHTMCVFYRQLGQILLKCDTGVLVLHINLQCSLNLGIVLWVYKISSSVISGLHQIAIPTKRRSFH
jgi:hypothetical protein